MKETKSFSIDRKGNLFIDGLVARAVEVEAFDKAFPGRRHKFTEGKVENEDSTMKIGEDGSVHIDGKSFKLNVDALGNLEFTDLRDAKGGLGPTTLKAKVNSVSSAAHIEREDPFLHWIANIPERILRLTALAVVSVASIIGVAYSSATTGAYVVVIFLASAAVLYPRGSS